MFYGIQLMQNNVSVKWNIDGKLKCIRTDLIVNLRNHCCVM